MEMFMNKYSDEFDNILIWCDYKMRSIDIIIFRWPNKGVNDYKKYNGRLALLLTIYIKFNNVNEKFYWYILSCIRN